MQKQERRLCYGFTLIELLIVIAIVILLAGIIYTASAPIREKGRQTVCMNNLKQIGIALQLYRADYEGLEASVGVRYSYPQLGLPRLPLFLKRYIRSDQVLMCPSDTRPPLRPGRRALSYTWNVWREDKRIGHYPPFSQCVAYRGEEYIVSACQNHQGASPKSGDLVPYLVLRLNGKVQVLREPFASDFYLW